jgi:1,4-dihydroxy-2-naphthoyl-CoA hydrolase
MEAADTLLDREPPGRWVKLTFLAIEHVEVGPGQLHARVAVRDDLLAPFRNLHGGVLAALSDHVLGTVLYPVIERGAWAATTEFKINYLAAVTVGVLDARPKIISLTKRTAVVRIDVENESRVVCAAQGTVLVVLSKK